MYESIGAIADEDLNWRFRQFERRIEDRVSVDSIRMDKFSPEKGLINRVDGIASNSRDQQSEHYSVGLSLSFDFSSLGDKNSIKLLQKSAYEYSLAHLEFVAADDLLKIKTYMLIRIQIDNNLQDALERLDILNSAANSGVAMKSVVTKMQWRVDKLRNLTEVNQTQLNISRNAFMLKYGLIEDELNELLNLPELYIFSYRSRACKKWIDCINRVSLTSGVYLAREQESQSLFSNIGVSGRLYNTINLSSRKTNVGYSGDLQIPIFSRMHKADARILKQKIESTKLLRQEIENILSRVAMLVVTENVNSEEDIIQKKIAACADMNLKRFEYNVIGYSLCADEALDVYSRDKLSDNDDYNDMREIANSAILKLLSEVYW